MRFAAVLFALLLVVEVGCGHYGSPRRPKPQAPPAHTNEPASADDEANDAENSAGESESKPSAGGSPGAY